MFLKQSKGFTLIELLVVIAIIGILSTLSIIALGNARAKSRDAKRVADIKQISTALDLYYADYGYYPTIITPGNPLTSADGTKTYMTTIPNNPSPRNDSGCGNNNYTYASTSDNTNYTLNFCISSPTGSLAAGINSASTGGNNTAPGLVGWWKFDEGTGTTAYDSSGNGNNGVWNGTGSNHYATGKIGAYAGNFNGSDDYVNIVNATNLNPDTSFTLSSWIYRLTTQNAEIIQKGPGAFTGGPGTQYEFGFVSSLFFQFQNRTASASYGTAISPSSINAWHHVVGVFESQTSVKVYVDGIQVGATQPAVTSGTLITSDPVKISHPSYPFNGLIDDVRIYNRALSAAEILALYNATK